MAFFEIKSLYYDADEIEKKILANMMKQNISYNKEHEFAQKYNLKSMNFRPLTPFKSLFRQLPRWRIRIAYELNNPFEFFKRWESQMKRDLINITLKDNASKNLKHRNQLEGLLYDRFLLMRHIEHIEEEFNKWNSDINIVKSTWSWRITTPLRLIKRAWKILIKKVL